MKIRFSKTFSLICMNSQQLLVRSAKIKSHKNKDQLNNTQFWSEFFLPGIKKNFGFDLLNRLKMSL